MKRVAGYMLFWFALIGGVSVAYMISTWDMPWQSFLGLIGL